MQYACRVHIPIAYHGRSSSIVVSGTPVRRPRQAISSSHSIPLVFKKLIFKLPVIACDAPPSAVERAVLHLFCQNVSCENG